MCHGGFSFGANAALHVQNHRAVHLTTQPLQNICGLALHVPVHHGRRRFLFVLRIIFQKRHLQLIITLDLTSIGSTWNRNCYLCYVQDKLVFSNSWRRQQLIRLQSPFHFPRSPGTPFLDIVYPPENSREGRQLLSSLNG